MKNLITLALMAGLATMAACSSEEDTGTDTDAGSGGASGGSGGATGGMGGMAGMASGGMAGMASGGTAGSDGGVGDCDTCVSGKCATELSACEANADCKKLLDCVNACADDACQTKCVTDNPNGVAAFQPVVTCSTTNCKTECGL